MASFRRARGETCERAMGLGGLRGLWRTLWRREVTAFVLPKLFTGRHRTPCRKRCGRKCRTFRRRSGQGSGRSPSRIPARPSCWHPYSVNPSPPNRRTSCRSRARTRLLPRLAHRNPPFHHRRGQDIQSSPNRTSARRTHCHPQAQAPTPSADQRRSPSIPHIRSRFAHAHKYPLCRRR